MKIILMFISFIISTFLTVSVQAAETYKLDSKHTYVLWSIKHLGFTTQVGKWYANGTLVLDRQNPKNSKIDATIAINDIVTGIPELDTHLKGKLFFDVTQFPTATFISDKVDITSKDTAKIYGKLTLHGISKPVVLNVKLNQIANNPLTDKMTVGFSATTNINRSDFNITTLLPALADNVKLNIEVEAYKT